MQTFPHRYSVTAFATERGDITLEADGLPVLHTAAPAEFDGPGDRWSPETLLVASVADCFALTFRGIARVSKLPWLSLSCDVTGVLDRVERTSQFTGFTLHARVRVPDKASEPLARRVVERAEQTCLVSNSLKGGARVEADVEIETEVTAAV
jgi:organic hydroperoxide reductase OsmC/OhrA